MSDLKDFSGCEKVLEFCWPADNDHGGYTACELTVFKVGEEFWVEAKSDAPSTEYARLLSKPENVDYKVDLYDWLGGDQADVFSELVERFVGTKVDEDTYVCLNNW